MELFDFRILMTLIAIIGFILGYHPEWLIKKKIKFNNNLLIGIIAFLFILRNYIYSNPYIILLNVLVLGIFFGSIFSNYKHKKKKK